MSSDRRWMYRRIDVRKKNISDEYRHGVDQFINFTLEHDCVDQLGRIRCPCTKCRNLYWRKIDVVTVHLLENGFIDGYLTWYRHGEERTASQSSQNVVRETTENNFDVVEMLQDAFGPSNIDCDVFDNSSENEEHAPNEEHIPNDRAAEFFKILSEAGVPLYEGCEKYSKLSAVTKLLHLKNDIGCSERGFDAMLSLIGDFLPKDHKLPSTYYEVKKMVRSLSLGYQKIDVCAKDCMLYYGDDKEKMECDFCHEPRYKIKKNGGKEHRSPRKILRYFPLTPRLQRLFMSSHTAEYMRWHKMRDVVPDHLTHPADGEEWKQFDANFPSFAKEARNVRLGLATDGFNPFTNFGKSYSVWPVIMVAYNLPPSMCMKDPYLFLTLLIPGPKSPRKDINVYLRPLVDELKFLWDTGVETYDKSLKNNFMMRAALFWTITDFPALGMISGWSTHGKLSCPVCMGNVRAIHLKNGGKPSFFGTARKFLPLDHHYRRQSVNFNRHIEKEIVPIRMSTSTVLEWLKQLVFPAPGLDNKFVRADGYGKLHNWTHACIFFELPYWVTLNVRHCIDVMHTEKNVFDNLFYTVLDVKGKTKDNEKSRLDLQALNIRPHLWTKPECSKPKADYTLTKQQLEKLCKWLNVLKLPDGYATNISRCSNGEQLKVTGLKSHDCHVFMQKLMPIAFREFLAKNIMEAINELSCFFRDLCSAQVRYEDIEKMEQNIVVTLCKLEIIFPPSFFDSMEHIPIHLPYELKYGGPVQYRWMYPFERYMGRLKRKVKNKARVEGSIAERYTEEELVNFCSLYFEDFIITKHNRLGRNEVADSDMHNDDELAIFTFPVKPFGEEKKRNLCDADVKKVGTYVLLNCPEVTSYLQPFEDEARAANPNLTGRQLDALIDSKFINWFEQKVKDENKYDRFKHVIRGPFRLISYYPSCIVNGYRFKVDEVNDLTSINSGVVVLGSCNEVNEASYYGRLEEVIELKYPGGKKVVVFKCRWFDTKNGLRLDRKHRFVTVNVKSRLNSDEVFILASQATQIYYAANVDDPSSEWYTVVTTKTRKFDDTILSQEYDAFQENVSAPTNVDMSIADLQLNVVETNNIANIQHDDEDFIYDYEEDDDENEEEEEDALSSDESDSDGFD